MAFYDCLGVRFVPFFGIWLHIPMNIKSNLTTSLLVTRWSRYSTKWSFASICCSNNLHTEPAPFFMFVRQFLVKKKKELVLYSHQKFLHLYFQPLSSVNDGCFDFDFRVMFYSQVFLMLCSIARCMFMCQNKNKYTIRTYIHFIYCWITLDVKHNN